MSIEHNEIKYMDFHMLQVLNDRAITRGYNRALDIDALVKEFWFDKTAVYTVTTQFFHQGMKSSNMRLVLTLGVDNDNPQQATLDVSHGDASLLPVVPSEKDR